MTTNPRLLVALAWTSALVLPACSSSSAGTTPEHGGSDASVIVDAGSDTSADADDGPSIIPGQCVFNGSTWNCGTGYGTYGECPGSSSPTLGTPCTYDGGCFFCFSGAGQSFSCVGGDWTFGNASGTTCTP